MACPVAPQGTAQSVTMTLLGALALLRLVNMRLAHFFAGKSPTPFARVPMVVVTMALRG